MPLGAYGLTCFSCQGNGITCEKSYTTTTCSGTQIYCRVNLGFFFQKTFFFYFNFLLQLDINEGSYPFVQQQCTDTCTETSDSSLTTYCTRADYGNCYKTQCNAVSGVSRVAATSGVMIFAAVSLTL